MERNKSNSPHYVWGEVCSGWHLVKNTDLSVIQEIMPPKSSEILHHHHRTQQFFYILDGVATFHLNEEIVKVGKGSGIYIEPGNPHRIENKQRSSNLEFLVISQPLVGNDRINV